MVTDYPPTHPPPGDLKPHPRHRTDNGLGALDYRGIPVPKALQDLTLAEVISEALFGADQPPRIDVVH
jgi:hypothetical protein